MAKKITFIGGGSAKFVSGLVRDLFTFDELYDARICRMDINEERIVRRSGIERCTLHDLRRTFASQLAMADVNQAVVQRLAGHASITTTLRHYTGIFPEVLRSAQMRLRYATGAGVPPNSTHGGREATHASEVKVVKLFSGVS